MIFSFSPTDDRRENGDFSRLNKYVFVGFLFSALFLAGIKLRRSMKLIRAFQNQIHHFINRHALNGFPTNRTMRFTDTRV
ncbi:MAG: hypothetical protein COX65_03915, partial [Elusimicrobia bacterium CG_4_10_14_0_2_um_filter_56_8]